MRKAYAIICLIAVCHVSMPFRLMGQVTIGSGNKPSPYSILELVSKSTAPGGVRIPHISDPAERKVIEDQLKAEIALGNTNGNGLTIYYLPSQELQYWDGVQWVSVNNQNLAAVNGLYIDKVSNTIGLGGNIPFDATPILNTGTNSLIINGTQNDFFSIGVPGTTYAKLFSVDGVNKRIGIGTNLPAASLDVRGTFSMRDGSEGTGKVLTYGSNGLASWQTSGVTLVPVKKAANGLTLSNDSVLLGGILLKNTTIATSSAKLLAVTGSSVNAFSVDGATFSVDAAGHKVGIGVAAPVSQLEIGGNENPVAHIHSTANTGGKGGTILFTELDQTYGMAIRHNTGLISGKVAEGLHFVAINSNVADTIMTMDQAVKNVGIGTRLPNSSAALEVSATNKGLLVPRVSLTSSAVSAPISSPATGLLVYNIGATANVGATTEVVQNNFYSWNGTKWIRILSQTDAGPWYKVGTTSSSTANTDNSYLNAQVVIGGNTPASLNGGADNAQLTVNGDASINGLTVGKGNGAVSTNTAMGVGSLKANGSAAYNTALGASALAANNTGTDNTAVGSQASLLGTTGAFNTAVGSFALDANVLGNSNTAIGNQALTDATGSSNIGIGRYAGKSLTSGSNNIAIGNYTQFPSVTGSNQINIGDAIYGVAGTRDASGNLLTMGSVGIGTASPTSTLHVKGGMRLEDGNQALGKILTSDANGNATWQTAAPTLTAGNGLHITSNNVRLGGDLTAESAIINALSNSISIRGGNKNFFNITDVGAANTIFSVDGSLRNVGVGVSAPVSQLEIGGNDNPVVHIHSTANTGGKGGTILFTEQATSYGMAIRHNTNIIAGKVAEGLHFASITNNVVDTIMTIDQNGKSVGIGTRLPQSKLHLVGTSGNTLRIEDENQLTGRVLTSDASGNASWQNAKVNTATGVMGTGGNLGTVSSSTYITLTGCQIILPPGEWLVFGTFLARSGGGAGTATQMGAGSAWVCVSLFDAPANTSPTGDFNTSTTLISGRVANESLDIIQGSLVVSNKTTSNKTYYLKAKLATATGTVGAISNFGTSSAGENVIFAIAR